MPSIKETIIYSLALAAGIQAAPVAVQTKEEQTQGFHTEGVAPFKWNKTVAEFQAEHKELPDRKKPWPHINPWERHESIPFHYMRLSGDHYTMMEHRTDFQDFGVEAYCSDKRGAEAYIIEMGIEHFEKELIIAADLAFNYLNRTHEWPKAVCLRKEPHTKGFSHACISWAPKFEWKIPQSIIGFIVNRAILCNKLNRSSEVQLIPVGIPGATWRANVCVGDSRWCNGPHPETVPKCGYENDIYGNKMRCPKDSGEKSEKESGEGAQKESGEESGKESGEESH